MDLPWLKDDYERPQSSSRSRSRSRSGSRGRRRSEEGRNRRSRSRSRSPQESRNYASRGARGQGGSRRGGGGGRSPDRGRRKRSRSKSSSSGSSDSRSSITRLVASTRPKYVNARIFVANLSSKDFSKAEIVSHFEKYGNVVDCLIHPKNYVFVQYLKAEHARLAVEGENGSTFNGFRINVKMANENRKAGGSPPARDGGGPGDRGDRDRDRDSGRPPREPREPRGPYGPDPFMHDKRPPPLFPPPAGDYGMRDPFYPPDPYRRGYPPDPWLPPDDPYRRDPFVDPYRDPYGPRLPPPPPPVPVGPVECEVFIINAQLRNYGEMIERRVKDQSIITALSIIPEGRKAPQMVEDLTAKSGLFAIFLNPQNEMHRSMTLNILHGTPQEHRNMPLDDAIGLIGRSFEKYVEELRAKANAAAAAAAAPTSNSVGRVFLPPSSEVTYLLNLLADNRALTVSELDSVINYLKERRDKMIDADKRPLASEDNDSRSERSRSERSFKEEKSDSTDNGQKNKAKEPKDETQATHEELTKKILSIFQGVDPSIAAKLTQSSTIAAQVPAPAPAPAPAPPPPPPKSSGSSSANLINFDNPNVQKALDNLIQSGPNLLKTFTSKSSNQSPTSSATTSIKVNPAPLLSSGNEFAMRGDGRGMRDDGQGMRGDGRGMRDDGQGMRGDGRGMRDDGQGMMDDGLGRRGDGRGMRDEGQGRRGDGQGMRDDGQGMRSDGLMGEHPGMMQAQAVAMSQGMGMMQPNSGMDMYTQQLAMDMNQALTAAFNMQGMGGPMGGQMGGQMGQMGGPMGQMGGPMGQMGGQMGQMGGTMGEQMGGPNGGPMGEQMGGPIGGQDFNLPPRPRGGPPPPPPPNQRY